VKTGDPPVTRFLSFLSIALALAPLGALAADAPARPNIVFILADDLGVNDLSCYGRKDQKTPNLDRMASEGMRFTSAYCAQPICSPSRAALMSGKCPARLHLTTFLPGRADAASQKLLHPKIRMELPLEEPTLAERLKAAGYKTGQVGKWHLGGAAFGPAQQGFDFVHVGKANTTPSETEGGKGEYDLTAAAEKFLDEHQAGPFYLHICHNTPHITLGAKPELVKQYADSFNPVYGAMMQTMDDCVGRVLAKLDALKLRDKTIVIFTSDNGGLHVLESPDSPATHNTPFRAGKGFVYEGGLRIPLVVRWPGLIPAGKVSGAPVIHTDWVPTLLAAAGVKTDASRAEDRFDGMDIQPILRGQPGGARTLWWHFPHYTNQGSRPAGALREGEWKIVEHYEDGRVELYNLLKDPGETRDLAPSDKERAAAMRDALHALRKEAGAQENTPNPAFDEALYRPLYVDVDVSRDKADATAAETRAKRQAWREGMNAAVRSPGKKSEKK
jgi:arylsulfatase A